MADLPSRPSRRVVGHAEMRLPIEVMPQPDGSGFLAHVDGDWHHGPSAARAVVAAVGASGASSVQFTEEFQREYGNAMGHDTAVSALMTTDVIAENRSLRDAIRRFLDGEIDSKELRYAAL